jgi:transcription termination factor Rho
MPGRRFFQFMRPEYPDGCRGPFEQEITDWTQEEVELLVECINLELPAGEGRRGWIVEKPLRGKERRRRS